jgi:hypothetical protein
MVCPACKVGVRFELSGSSEVFDEPEKRDQQGYDVGYGFCPECAQFIVLLRRGRYYQGDFNDAGTRELMPPLSTQVIFPRMAARPVDSEIPAPYRHDFLEAAAVLETSTKASAALSRRILQQVLRDELKIKATSLAHEIEVFLGMAGIPSHLIKAVDAVRHIGNFAAHPTKNDRTGEIVDVEPGEAEWLLDVLDALFDFVFVQPRRLTERRAALNAKLAGAGKPPMKGEPEA